MDMAQEYGVVSLPVVIILRDLRVHISGPNSSDIPARIEGMIYQQLCFGSIFRIPMSNQMIAMSDLEEALMTLGFAARFTGSNNSRCFIVVMMSLPVSLLLLGCI